MRSCLLKAQETHLRSSFTRFVSKPLRPFAERCSFRAWYDTICLPWEVWAWLSLVNVEEMQVGGGRALEL